MADDAPNTVRGADRRPNPATATEHHPLAVVVIGVSAASLRSLERLLAAMPHDSGAAFVVAAQHGDAVDQEELLRRLQDWSGSLPCSLAADEVPLGPNEFYLSPVGALTSVEDGHLRVRRSDQPSSESGVIDTLAVSVAKEWRERSILVVLSGLGNDGVLGTTASKERGGLAIAEAGEQPDAAGNGAAGGEGAANIADFVLSVEAIPERITAHVRHLQALRTAQGDDAAREQVAAQLAGLASVLRRKTGHDFHGYKHSTLPAPGAASHAGCADRQRRSVYRAPAELGRRGPAPVPGSP